MQVPVIDADNCYVDDVDELFAAMRTTGGKVLIGRDGLYEMAIISKVEREDGSGWKFNVYVYMVNRDEPGQQEVFFVRDLKSMGQSAPLKPNARAIARMKAKKDKKGKKKDRKGWVRSPQMSMSDD